MNEHGVYVKYVYNMRLEKLIVRLFVDDLLLVTGSNAELITQFKYQMLSEFEMSDLEELNYFLGIEFTRTEHGTIMHQTKYAHDLLSRFEMHHNNNVATPVKVGLRLLKKTNEEPVDPTLYRKIVGSLRYSCSTKPNLNFGVSLISKFTQKTISHECCKKDIKVPTKHNNVWYFVSHEKI